MQTALDVAGGLLPLRRRRGCGLTLDAGKDPLACRPLDRVNVAAQSGNALDRVGDIPVARGLDGSGEVRCLFV